jgi:signal transduction histidine kinase/ActR/RegA family two-component response regulator
LQDTSFNGVEHDDLEDLFENAPCGYLSLGTDARIRRCNNTFGRWLGFDPASLVGKRFPDLLTIAGKIYFETHFAPLLKMQGFFDEVALDIATEAEPLPVLVNAVQRDAAGGAPSFIRVTVFKATDRRRYERELLEARRRADEANAELARLNQDLEQRVTDEVTSRMQAEEALRQAQKMEAIGQLTGGIAHDFNNMLASVIGGLNLTQRRLSRGDLDVDKFIEGALESAYRAARLTQRLLQFSRQSPLEPVALDVNKLTSGMSDLLARTLGETIHVETVLSAGLWNAKADPGQLENVVLNLAVNARDAMPDGGNLTIETSNTFVDEAYASDNEMVEGQYVLIAVTDTGHGMPADVLAKVFDPFFTTKPVGKGTGLGMSQVYGFAKQSGGHVKIYSEVDHGTTVKLYLPRQVGTATSVARPKAELAPSGGSETVLVVEDEDRVRNFAAEALRELGYNVLEAGDGPAALAVLQSERDTALLFTDVVMPGMTGRELADHAVSSRPELKVLYSTGYTRNAIVHNGVVDAGTNFLQKPYSLNDLARKVRAVLDGNSLKKVEEKLLF